MAVPDKEGSPTSDAALPRFAKGHWMQLAQRLQEESDPQKIIDLAQQLVEEFDRTGSNANPDQAQSQSFVKTVRLGPHKFACSSEHVSPENRFLCTASSRIIDAATHG